MRTCITGAHFFDGKRVRTIEGHATRERHGEVQLSPVQKSFLEHFSFQCGYCTPGFVNATTVLVERLTHEPVAKDRLEDDDHAGARRASMPLHRLRALLRGGEGARALDARAREGGRNEPRRLSVRACGARPRAGSPCWRWRRAGQPRRRRPPHPPSARSSAAVPRRGRRLRGLPHRARRGADCGARCLDYVGLRDVLRHQHHAGSQARDRRLECGRRSTRRCTTALRPRAPAVPGNAVHVVPAMPRDDVDADLRVSDGSSNRWRWRAGGRTARSRSTCAGHLRVEVAVPRERALPDASKGASADWRADAIWPTRSAIAPSATRRADGSGN